MKVAIIGYGREGRSLYSFLRRDPEFREADIWILDQDPRLKAPRGTRVRTGKNYLTGLKDFDLAFRSPGIPYNAPEFRAARKAGVVFSSATRLFFERCPGKTIGVTGSKGKTTTTTLLYRMLCAGKKKAVLAGNIGLPMLDALPRIDRSTWVVLELSSFQAQDMEQSPEIGVLLDIFPEHQDAHGSLREYYCAKQNLILHQRAGDRTFYFSHNPTTARLARGSQGKKIPVGENGFTLFSANELKMKGLPAFRNTIMAAEVARAVGVSAGAIRKTARSFPGVAHRLELVRTLRSGPGRVSFYNDSASTNPMTSANAVSSFRGTPNALIAGGHDKNLDFAPLRKALRGSSTAFVVLFGANRKKILRSIRPSGVHTAQASSLRDAVRKAFREMRRVPGEAAVILSPGAASFDMFRNYADRGEQFRAAVRAL